MEKIYPYKAISFFVIDNFLELSDIYHLYPELIFDKYDDCNCIVHFHCPLKLKHSHNIPIVSQKEYECGSHQCGENTANGLGKFGDLYCVMLDNHGPNIVFNSSIDPNYVIWFIANNFELDASTSGFEKVYLGLKETV